MAATAEAVANLHLQNGSAAGWHQNHETKQPGSDNAEEVSAALEAQEDAVCGQIGLLLNPADSGYLADTEGQTTALPGAAGSMKGSNGFKHLRPRGPATRTSAGVQ